MENFDIEIELLNRSGDFAYCRLIDARMASLEQVGRISRLYEIRIGLFDVSTIAAGGVAGHSLRSGTFCRIGKAAETKIVSCDELQRYAEE